MMFLQKQTALSSIKILLVISFVAASATVLAWSRSPAAEPLPIPSEPGVITSVASHANIRQLPIASTYIAPGSVPSRDTPATPQTEDNSPTPSKEESATISPVAPEVPLEATEARGIVTGIVRTTSDTTRHITQVVDDVFPPRLLDVNLSLGL